MSHDLVQLAEPKSSSFSSGFLWWKSRVAGWLSPHFMHFPPKYSIHLILCSLASIRLRTLRVSACRFLHRFVRSVLVNYLLRLGLHNQILYGPVSGLDNDINLLSW